MVAANTQAFLADMSVAREVSITKMRDHSRGGRAGRNIPNSTASLPSSRAAWAPLTHSYRSCNERAITGHRVLHMRLIKKSLCVVAAIVAHKDKLVQRGPEPLAHTRRMLRIETVLRVVVILGW